MRAALQIMKKALRDEHSMVETLVDAGCKDNLVLALQAVVQNANGTFIPSLEVRLRFEGGFATRKDAG